MTIAHVRRLLYRGKRPGWIAKALNQAWATIVSAGMGGDLYVTLEVPGRKSGKLVSLPLVVAVVDGQRYLVSMLGKDAQWVKNVRAANGKVVLKHGRREKVQLEEVAIGQRAPLIKAYMQCAPGAVPHFPVSKDASLTEFEKIAADFPVFRVVAIS
ncbi:MAG: nitroreductase family deazaflavin-dependent oxidoreductase [Anaerolineae bacterium]|nr:nitroreductase family deazaflavin-dependent oxidoreductase [Anaerolineae bacterium]